MCHIPPLAVEGFRAPVSALFEQRVGAHIALESIGRQRMARFHPIIVVEKRIFLDAFLYVFAQLQSRHPQNRDSLFELGRQMKVLLKS